MTARSVPWRLLGFIAIAVFAFAGLNNALGYLPFSPQWFGKRAVAKVEGLEAQVSTLEREGTGNAEIAAATETYHTREIIIREGTAEAIAQARSAPDAATPLSDERASRLRSHDLRLCDQFPGLCAAPDASDSGADAVPASDPSR